MLFLEEIDEVRRRADANQALHGVQDDVNLSLSHGIRPIYHSYWAVSQGNATSLQRSTKFRLMPVSLTE